MIVNNNGKIWSPEQFMLDFGNSRQAFPEKSGKEKSRSYLGCLMVYDKIKVCLMAMLKVYFLYLESLFYQVLHI